PAAGFFRPTTVPHTIFPAPPPDGTLEDRVWSSLKALQQGLDVDASQGFDVLHGQDCIAGRAVVALREAGAPVLTVRTVHHVDDFTTEALVECQRRSILDPDRVLAVSRYWRRRLADEFGVGADVVTNGVNPQRSRRPGGLDSAALRARIGATGRTLFLTVGGIEPRKGTRELVEAMSMLRGRLVPAPLLAIVGGHSFQDYRPYAASVLARARALGLETGSDIVILGTVSDAELAGWYHSADAFVFPSVKEGWGLALLEAMAAGLPAVTTDIPVFREFLAPGDAVLVPPADAAALSQAMFAVATDHALRQRLALAGPKVAGRYTWEACASQHLALYQRLVTGGGSLQPDS
ncbi:MAG: MSMEG_0565 family glycosyltransferase, partial [Streptosporangiaceae bacterium]